MNNYSPKNNQLIKEVFEFDRKTNSDQRGSFQRLYCKNTLQKMDVYEPIVQSNLSITKSKGTIRGMHYQHSPSMETKIISCLSGEVFDVAVDLRRDSPTFLQHKTFVLSASKNQSIVIPKGFAHGFQSLTDNVQLLYFHTANYNPDAEAGISPFEKKLDICWPLKTTVVSKKDLAYENLSDQYKGVSL